MSNEKPSTPAGGGTRVTISNPPRIVQNSYGVRPAPAPAPKPTTGQQGGTETK